MPKTFYRLGWALSQTLDMRRHPAGYSRLFSANLELPHEGHLPTLILSGSWKLSREGGLWR